MNKFKEIPNCSGIKCLEKDRIFINGTYQVNVRLLEGSWDGWLWFSIKRYDKDAIRDWREFQLIKNLIAGEEREAVELYPAESRLVDTSNQYHLYVYPTGQKFPWGFEERLIVSGHDLTAIRGGTRQRDFKEDEKPKDCLTLEEVSKLAEDYLAKNGED